MDPITALLATILTNITMGMSEKKKEPRKEVPKATMSEDDQIGCVFFLMLFMLSAVILALSYFIITLTGAKGPLAQLSIIFMCFFLCVIIVALYLHKKFSGENKDATKQPKDIDGQDDLKEKVTEG